MAVDVCHFEGAGLAHTHSRGIDGLQQCALARACTGGKQAPNLLTRQQFRLLGWCLGKDNLEVFARMPQYALEQELGCAGGLVHGAVGELALFDHVQQVGLYFIGGVGRGVAPVVPDHAHNGLYVGLLRTLCKAALHHGVNHALAKFTHDNLLQSPGKIPRLEACLYWPLAQATHQQKTRWQSA